MSSERKSESTEKGNVSFLTETIMRLYHTTAEFATSGLSTNSLLHLGSRRTHHNAGNFVGRERPKHYSDCLSANA